MIWVGLLTIILLIVVMIAVLTEDMMALVHFLLLTGLSTGAMLVWIDINYGTTGVEDIPQSCAFAGILSLAIIIVRSARSGDNG